MTNHFCIQWPKFGPYHVARLKAVVELFESNGHVVTGIQTASSDQSNSWGVRNLENHKLHTLFPNSDLHDLDPTVVRKTMIGFLDERQPVAIAINGYSQADARACLEWCLHNDAIAILMTDSRYADTKRTTLKESIKKVIVQNFDSALVAGSESSTYMQELGLPANRIVKGYDVVDNRHFEKPAADGNSFASEHKPYFLTVSRFIQRKGIDLLLDEYRSYRQTCDAPWNLVIAGDDPAKLPPAQRAIDGVIYAGVIRYEMLPALYLNAQALVHPARSDQWGLVVNEAMAAGLPVAVSSGAGSAADLVHPGENGFVFNITAEGELAAILKTMTSEAEALHRMGAQSRKIITDYTPESFSKNLWACFSLGRSQSGTAVPGLLALKIGNLLTRRQTSFHSIES